MRLNTKEIDSLEDIRVLMLSRCQGPQGMVTARNYANNLMNRAMTAFACGDFHAAVSFCSREFEFNCRAFGFSHPFTLSAKNCLISLKNHVNGQGSKKQKTATLSRVISRSQVMMKKAVTRSRVS